MTPKGRMAVAENRQGGFTAKPYPAGCHACIGEAERELRENVRPKLKQYMASLEGKRIIRFCASGGNGMDSSGRDLEKLCPGAKLEKGLAICGCETGKPGGNILAWEKEMMGQ